MTTEDKKKLIVNVAKEMDLMNEKVNERCRQMQQEQSLTDSMINLFTVKGVNK